jgi:hypothetical protein
MNGSLEPFIEFKRWRVRAGQKAIVNRADSLNA